VTREQKPIEYEVRKARSSQIDTMQEKQTLDKTKQH